MGQFKRMLGYLGLRKPKANIESTPNTWGHQVYEHQFRKMKKDHQMNLNNHTCNKGFIEKFTTTYVTGAHLKNRLNEYRISTSH